MPTIAYEPVNSPKVPRKLPILWVASICLGLFSLFLTAVSSHFVIMIAAAKVPAWYRSLCGAFGAQGEKTVWIPFFVLPFTLWGLPLVNAIYLFVALRLEKWVPQSKVRQTAVIVLILDILSIPTSIVFVCLYILIQMGK